MNLGEMIKKLEVIDDLIDELELRDQDTLSSDLIPLAISILLALPSVPTKALAVVKTVGGFITGAKLKKLVDSLKDDINISEKQLLQDKNVVESVKWILQDFYEMGINRNSPDFTKAIDNWILSKNKGTDSFKNSFGTFAKRMKEIQDNLIKVYPEYASKNYMAYINNEKIFLKEIEDLGNIIQFDWLNIIIQEEARLKNPKSDTNLIDTNISKTWDIFMKRDPFLPLGMSNQKNMNYDVSSSLSSQHGFNLLEPLKKLEDLQQGMVTYSDYFTTLNDIMSSLNPSMDVSSMLGDNYAYDMPEFSLSQSAGSSAGSGFTMGSGITIPLEYDINISGLEEFGALNQAIDESSKSLEQTDDLAKSASNQIMEQYQNLISEQISLNATVTAFNVSGITVPFLNISTSFKDTDEEANIFAETLMDIADIAGKIGGAFMNVDEEIGKAIGSAGGLAGGISEIYTAMNKDPLAGMNTSKMTPEQIEAAKKQGEKQNGLAIMSGIQGVFAGLQGLFGGEPGSDMSGLLGGLGGLGACVAGLLTDREPDSFHLRVLNA